MKIFKEPTTRFVVYENTSWQRARHVLHAESEVDALQRYLMWRKETIKEPITEGGVRIHVAPIGDESVFVTQEEPSDGIDEAKVEQGQDDDGDA